MLDVLLKSQIGLLSIATILGSVVVVGAWAIYFIRQQNKKQNQNDQQ